MKSRPKEPPIEPQTDEAGNKYFEASGIQFRDPVVIDWRDELWLKVYATNQQGYTGELNIPLKAFSNPSEFNHETGKWDFFWTSSKEQLMELKNALTEEAGAYLTGTGMIGRISYWESRTLMEVDTHPLRGKIELKGCRTQKLAHLQGLMTKLQNIDPSVWLILGWFAAAPFAPEFRKKYEMFPILQLFGEQGSGKTDLARLFGGMFCWEGDLESWKASEYVITRLFSSTDCFPVIFDEYTDDPFKSEILKLVPYGARWTKGRWAQGPSQVQMDLKATVCLVGETSIATPSVLERTLVIELRKSKRLDMQTWNYCLRAAQDLKLGDYFKWAMQQTLDWPRPDERPRREEMGWKVVTLGLQYLNQWLHEATDGLATLNVPSIEKEHCMVHKEFADDGLVFLRLALNMYRAGDFARTTAAIQETQDGKFYVSMSQVWPYVKERAGRIGVQVKDARILGKLLSDKPYTISKPCTRQVGGRQVRAWTFDIAMIEDEDINL